MPRADGFAATSTQYRCMDHGPDVDEPTPGLARQSTASVALALTLLALGTATALAIWPFGATDRPWPLAAGCVPSGRLPTVGKSWVEGLIGSAPGWLRGTLVATVLSQALSGLIGFRRFSRVRRCVGQCVCCRCEDHRGVPLSERTLVTQEEVDRKNVSEAIATLKADQQLAQSFGPGLAESLERQEARLAVSRLRQRGLLRLVLTGHGLRPVIDGRSSAAGWLGIADASTRQSSWTEARKDLGLSVRQAGGVSLLKLICWHWVQPLACKCRCPEF